MKKFLALTLVLFIVVGIAADRNEVLLHEISPAGVPWIARQLGAYEAGP
jgi:hypothetical protein